MKNIIARPRLFWPVQKSCKTKINIGNLKKAGQIGKMSDDINNRYFCIDVILVSET